MQEIKLLGIPYNFGQPHKGVAHGAEALRTYKLTSILDKYARTKDLGNMDFSLIPHTEIQFIKDGSANSIANELISGCIETEDLKKSFLLNVGGDHGMALGTIHGILSHRPDTVVVWADAHGDINTPQSSLSGNFHGMPLSFLLNISTTGGFEWIKNKLSPEKLILIGPRDLDPEEHSIIKALGIQYYDSSTMNKFGTREILRHALKKADPEGTCPIHLSFDVDLFDAEDVYSTGTRVQGGPELSQVLHIGRFLGETGRLTSMDVVELNPEIGTITDVDRTVLLTLQVIETTISSVFKDKDLELPLIRQIMKKYLEGSSLLNQTA